MAYHFRLEIPTGYVPEVRDMIDGVDIVDAQVDGSIFTRNNDTTLVTVRSDELVSLAAVYEWLVRQPADVDIALITPIGTPASMRESELATLQQMVMSHQAVGVEEPASNG